MALIFIAVPFRFVVIPVNPRHKAGGFHAILEAAGLYFLGVDPLHHLAELAADLFELAGVVLLVERVEVLQAAFVFGDPFLGELRREVISPRIFFISALVWSVMIRGPRVRSPYSAVLEML